MWRVTGLGGLFFKARNPQALYEWYEKHLGIEREPHSEAAAFRWRDWDNPEQKGMTIFSIFPESTRYFGNSKSPFMVNFRVENLDALLQALREEGIEIDPKVEDYEYGRFAWITDPEGNRIELWEPKGEV